MTNSGRMKKSRDPLHPKPILDRGYLSRALKEDGIVVKDAHIDTFYQLLHRQEYPSLSDFVKEYYSMEQPTSSAVEEEEEKKEVEASLCRNPIGKRRRLLRQLPKALLDFLSQKNTSQEFVTMTSKIASHRTSKDGTTTKLAVELQDGHVVESVIMRHPNSRATLCVSSQVGCAMGCTFCATGTMGIRGNLCSGEILEQLVHASLLLLKDDDDDDDHDENCSKVNASKKQQKLIRNIVFMGMGEPLNNYKNVVEACRVMIDRKRWNLAHGHVTVSTVGVTPKMRQLTRDLPEINLALSLHAPNQRLRESIVPTAKQYPIQDMVQALHEHMLLPSASKDNHSKNESNQHKNNHRNQMSHKRKRAMIEYVMLEGETSTVQSAHELGKLCENRNHLVVNLIPYNKTNVKDKLSCPSEEHLQLFQKIVSSYGVFCTIRRTMGADIAGACGQLVIEEEQKQKQTTIDIEDGPFSKTNNNNNSSHTQQKNNRTDENSRKITVTRNVGTNNKKNKQTNQVLTNISDKCDNNRKDDKINNLDRWIKPLTIATGIAGSLFIISSLVLMSVGKRKR